MRIFLSVNFDNLTAVAAEIDDLPTPEFPIKAVTEEQIYFYHFIYCLQQFIWH